ncbi:MAG: hydrogenase formation protein HypD, partial [Chromatiales bacterium]|nr:hydrogenase formation protein HypD [Chromatiales bacterium]
MKYIAPFRDHALAQRLAVAIRAAVKPQRDYRLMEFCGGHTHAIFRYGVQGLMPENLHYIHGPGCPVCVLPSGRITMALQLLREHAPILCSYADLMRVPTRDRDSLFRARAEGFDVRMVYSTQDVLTIARDNPQREVVFFAIGFETTTPATAVAITHAEREGLKNLSVFCNHLLTPPAMAAILQQGETTIDGFLGPSHVSTIIGCRAYQPIAAAYEKPLVIAGFEPLDVMQSTLMLIEQINGGRSEVENEYCRAVSEAGNQKAQSLMDEVFALREEFAWRGLGLINNSALQIRSDYAAFDAEKRFAMTPLTAEEPRGCD